MKKSKKQLILLRWISRILAIIITLFGLPFYFGYGNPLPFINSNYALWDNIWLTVFPFMFTGLIVGLKFEKIGGFLVVVPILIGLILGLIVENDFSIHMMVPLIVGLLFLTSGYYKSTKNK